MAEALASHLDFHLLARRIHRIVAEWLRLCSVYLGIVVIVTVSMGVALPGLRSQALQVHEALLASLAPASATMQAGQDAAGEGVSPAAVVLAIPNAPASNATAFLSPPRPAPKPVAKPPAQDGGVSRNQMDALNSYISRKYKVANDATGVLIKTAFKVGGEHDLDPLLLLAVMAIESRYNPFAESPVGAQGLMQVMTSVHQEKFEKFGDNAALDPVANIRVGSTILRDCIQRRGSVNAGLSCYVGATGPNDGGYSGKVQAERRRLALASGIALARE